MEILGGDKVYLDGIGLFLGFCCFFYGLQLLFYPFPFGPGNFRGEDVFLFEYAGHRRGGEGNTLMFCKEFCVMLKIGILVFSALDAYFTLTLLPMTIQGYLTYRQETVKHGKRNMTEGLPWNVLTNVRKKTIN